MRFIRKNIRMLEGKYPSFKAFVVKEFLVQKSCVAVRDRTWNFSSIMVYRFQEDRRFESGYWHNFFALIFFAKTGQSYN